MVSPSIRSEKIKPAIVIPVHQENPTIDEKISFTQCQKVFGKRDIFLVAPSNLNIDIYRSIFPHLKTILLRPELMGSIGAYNKPMISPIIFSHLSSYSHALIHEPDSLVLGDELDYWCNQKLDYIGAPWMEYCQITHKILPKKVGNFGFSLINIKSANAIFSRNHRWYGVSMIIRDLLRGVVKKKRGATHKALRACGGSGLLSNASELFDDHCDIFWSFIVPKIEPWFVIAEPQQAAHFSWETYPESCYEFCNRQMPFGIHAWSKYNREFLTPLLRKSGVNLEI